MPHNEEEIKKLYKVVSDEGLYTKSFAEFEQKYNSPESIDKLYNVVSQQGLYTKSKDDFYSKYYPDFSKKKVGGVPLFSGSNNLQTGVQNGTSNTSPSKYPSISGWKKEPTQKKPFDINEWTLPPMKTGNPEADMYIQENYNVSQGKKKFIDDAINNTVNQRLAKAHYPYTNYKPNSTEIQNERDVVEQEFKKGNFVPSRDEQGNPVMKTGGGFFDSYNDAYNEALNETVENKMLTNMSKEDAIKWLNFRYEHPESLYKRSTEPNSILGVLGDVVGKNINLIGKGTAGAYGGAALAPESGGASIGSFLSMAHDLATSGYSEALRKNYFIFKKQGLSNEQAYDKAHNAALVGEATNLGTGVLLSGELPMPKINTEGVLNGLEQSVKHTITSSPKVIGSASGGALINDITSNLEGAGLSKEDIKKDVTDAAKNMAVMHLGLNALSIIANGGKSAVPSYMRPQLENVVSSAPRETVEKFYRDKEASGEVPEGTTDKVLNKLSEFDQQKKAVNDMPLSEESKASITGKLIQRKNILDENEQLKKYGGSFNSRIEQNEQKIKNLDAQIDGIVKTDKPFQFETDDITGTSLAVGKPFDELSKKEQEGITVPPEYGSIEIEQVKTKEGEEPKFIAKAFYSERKSDAMTLNHEIKIDKKEYSSKPEAKKAAEQALAKHYYENGLKEYQKPQVENAKEETKTEIPDKETMGGSVTDNEREQTDESSQTEKSDAENLQPQQDKLTPSSKPMGEGGEQGGRDVDVKKQIEDFGVPKEDVEATHGLLGQVFNGLKKAGLTAAKTVGDWVGIGKGEEKPYTLKINGEEKTVKPVNADVVNGFYSPLEKTINETKFDKLPAKQWIEKFARGEEAKWTGLNEWLSQQQGSVSKADIQNFLKEKEKEKKVAPK